MSFIGNHAEVQGGAISVRTPTVGLDTDIVRLFNTRCFIQYEFSNAPSSIDPAEWKVNEILLVVLSHKLSYVMSMILVISMQTSVSFINNTAEINGAAVYATSINECVYTPSLEIVNSSTIFERSIFQLSQQFIFRYELLQTCIDIVLQLTRY